MAVIKYLKSPNILIGLAEALSKLATFIVLPLSGLVLSTTEFNIWSLVFPSIQVLSTAISFGLPSYILRAYYVNSNEEKHTIHNQVYNSFLIITGVAALLFCTGLVFHISSPFFRWDIYGLVITNSFLLIIQQKYQAEKKGMPYLLQSLVWRNFFALILVGAILLHLQVSLNGLLWSLLFIQGILCVWGALKECIPFELSIKPDIQRSIFTFGFPLFLIGALQYIVSINGRFFVYNKGIENDTAFFAIVQTFVGGLNLLFVIFVRIYVPKLFGVLNGSETFESLNIYKKVAFPLFEILSVGILVCLFIYSGFYKVSFEDKIFILTPILIVGQFFYGVQIFVVDSMVYQGHTIKLLIVNIVVTFFSIILGFVLVKYYGVLGGAVSVAATQLISFLLIVIMTKSLFKSIIGINFFFLTLLKIITMLFALGLIYHFSGKRVLLGCMALVLIFLGVRLKRISGDSFFKGNFLHK